MTIYALHQHNNRKDSPTSPLEAFPSVERASVALQTRARRKESGTFFVNEGDDLDVWPRPMVKFPEADETGFMLVWRRKSNDPRPRPEQETPDEVWRLRPTGGVVKVPYAEDQLSGARPPQPSPELRRRAALAGVAELPPLTDDFKADLSPTWRMLLRDLVQDPEVEDGVLRVMQADWAGHRSRA